MLAVQAQELPAACLALRARGKDFTSTGVDKELQSGGSLVRTWALRGTLHLLARDDAAWLVPLLAPTCIASNSRRMAQLGWDEQRTARGLKLLQHALDEQGELPRQAVRPLLEREGLPHAGQAPVHLLYRAAFEGILCYGPTYNRKETYVPFESWVGSWQSLPCEGALVQLARRYLQAYAPAGASDLAAWSGLSLRAARQALAELESQLEAVSIEGQPGWMLAEQLSWLDEVAGSHAPQARLLPRFDTYLLGYAGRGLAVDESHARRVHPGGGILRAAAAVDGRVVGLWKAAAKRSRLELTIECFEPLAPKALAGLEAETADVGRFLGLPATLSAVNML